eukprot:169872_1
MPSVLTVNCITFKLFIVLLIYLMPNAICNECYFVPFLHYFTVLNKCWRQPRQNESVIHQCYNNDTYQIIYNDLNCNELIKSNNTIELSSGCDSLQPCDFIDFSYRNSNSDILDCNSTPAELSQMSGSWVANKCLYDSDKHLYRINTCTSDSMNIIYYNDSTCNENIVSSVKYNHCISNTHGLISINQCSSSFNDIDCAFVQFGKSDWPVPLNECIFLIYKSVWYKCIANSVVVYEFINTNECNFSEKHSNQTVTPFSYSCSSKTCNYVRLDIFENVNCINDTPTNLENKFYSKPLITDECINVFDENNFVTSRKHRCHGSYIREYVYQDTICDISTFQNLYHYVDDCLDNDRYQDIICSNDYENSTIPLTPDPTTSYQYNQTRNKYVIYVNKDGHDEPNCGLTKDDACGTILWASFILYQSNVSIIEMIVQGQNVFAIEYWSHLYGRNPCIPLISIAFNVFIITFDENYIFQMDDWYPIQHCEVAEEGLDSFFGGLRFVKDTVDSSLQLIINNLRFDTYTFDSRSNQPTHIFSTFSNIYFECNNCIFQHIDVTYKHSSNISSNTALIVGPVQKFVNCIFSNISYINNKTNEYTFSIIHVNDNVNVLGNYNYYNFIMNGNSYVENINNFGSFIYIEPENNLINNYISRLDDNYTESVNVEINNITFININIIYAIVYSDSRMTMDLNITNCQIENLEFGSVLYSFGTRSKIRIYNVYISTPQTISQYLERKTLLTSKTDDYYSLFIFDTSFDSIVMENIEVKYLYASYLNERCTAYHYAVFKLTNVLCMLPFQLIDSNAILSIFNLTIYNDIGSQQLVKFQNDTLSSLFMDEGEFHLRISWDSNLGLDSQFYYYTNYAIIQNHGELKIDSFYVHGGVHKGIIYSPDGDLSIEKMVCSDQIHQPGIFSISTTISFGEVNSVCDNSLTISNSIISRTSESAILIESGNVYISNITIQMVTIAITVQGSTRYFSLKQSNIIDIGIFYSSISFATILGTILPMYFDGAEMHIENNTFKYFDPYQFNMIYHKWYETYWLPSEHNIEKSVSFINNVFEINDINILDVYKANLSIHQILKSQINMDQYQHINGMLTVGDNMNVKLINNIFQVNKNNLNITEDYVAATGIPWIYMDGNEICMSGNTFTDYAIYLHAGTITSCVRNELALFNNVSGCESFGTYGSINNDALSINNYQPNVFMIKHYNQNYSIVAVDEEGIFALENILTINSLPMVNNTQYVFNIVRGTYTLVEFAYIHQENNLDTIPILVGDNCVKKCYKIQNNHTISVLHIQCNNTNNDNEENVDLLVNKYDAIITNNSQPFYIHLTPQNNGTFFPGSTLSINYAIYDKYRKVISQTNQELFITLKSISSDLFGIFNLRIEENGYCQQCIDGIFLQSATLDMLYNDYSFEIMVENNYLIPMNQYMNVTIIECAQGFGSTTLQSRQCEPCKKGYTNLIPTIDQCFVCETQGILCEGQDNIIISYSFWMNVIINDGNQHIISGKCVPTQCCQNIDGCNFIYDNVSLCAVGRDSNTPLCGKCQENYSEMFGTLKCQICKENHWERLIFPFLYGFIWFIFIIITKSESINNNKFGMETKSECNCCRKWKIGKLNKDDYDDMTREEYTESLQIMVSKGILYYYQSISYIISTSQIQIVFIGFVNLFNLDIFSFLFNDSDGFCFLTNMTMIQKILLPLTVTASIFIFIAITWCLNRCSLNVLACCKRKPIFGQVIVTAFLICIGQILYVSSQLLACRKIHENINVHYFFGSHDCFDWIWWLSLIILILFCMIFAVLFVTVKIKMRRKNNSDNEINDNAYYRPIVWCYKKK